MLVSYRPLATRPSPGVVRVLEPRDENSCNIPGCVEVRTTYSVQSDTPGAARISRCSSFRGAKNHRQGSDSAEEPGEEESD